MSETGELKRKIREEFGVYKGIPFKNVEHTQVEKILDEAAKEFPRSAYVSPLQQTPENYEKMLLEEENRWHRAAYEWFKRWFGEAQK